MRIFASPEELGAAQGEHLGFSDWHVVGQERINAFADTTEDRQWIHIDPERAARSPFGTAIAHGYLTLAMVPAMTREIYTLNGVRMGVNYGLNKVRFMTPVRAGSRIRAGAQLQEVKEFDNGWQVTLLVQIETEDATKPACVAETVGRFYS